MASEPLGSFLKSRGVDDTLAPALAKPPFCCTTVQQFAYGFKDMDEVRSRFCESPTEPMATLFKDNMGGMATLLAAWDAARSRQDRALKRDREDQPQEDLDSELRKEVHDSLHGTFAKTSFAKVPPGLMGPGAFLGRLHRELKDRTKHSLHLIRMVRSQTIALEWGPATKKERVGNSGLTWEHTRETPAQAPRTCFQYLYGLSIYLYTLGVAGAYEVMWKGTPQLMISWQDLLDHLSQANVYVARYTTGRNPFPDNVVLTQLRATDEAIRGTWGTAFRGNDPENVPFGVCIQDNKSTAAALWLTAPQGPKTPGKGQNLGGFATREGQRQRGGKGGQGGQQGQQQQQQQQWNTW